MVRISENQQFSDFLSFSREIPVPFSTVSKFSEVEVERSESALGKLVPTKQRIVYSFIGSYTRGRWGGGWGGAQQSFIRLLTLLYSLFQEKGTPFTYLFENFASLLTAVNALSFK